jgi:hypothetical protein
MDAMVKVGMSRSLPCFFTLLKVAFALAVVSGAVGANVGSMSAGR